MVDIRVQYPWATYVYLPRGVVTHVLAPGGDPNIGYSWSGCEKQPKLGEQWWGTGSQEEMEKAARMPVCGECIEYLRRFKPS